jgi:hypothetical protein
MSLRASSSPSTALRCGAKSSWELDEKKAPGTRRLANEWAVRVKAELRRIEDNILVGERMRVTSRK